MRKAMVAFLASGLGLGLSALGRAASAVASPQAGAPAAGKPQPSLQAAQAGPQARTPVADRAQSGIAPNSGFEEGAPAPQGWLGVTNAILGAGRNRGRSIGARTPHEAVTWVSEPIDLEAEQSYRLDGWIRCRRGKAVLGLDLLNDQGAVVATAAAPAVSATPGWQYVAVEKDVPRQAPAARIWLKVAGEAYLDDVKLAPMVRNLVFNPGFDVDAKGRIGFWNQEAAEGAEGGSSRGDPAGRSGSGLLIEADSRGWGVRCVAWPVVEGVTAYRFSGWARGENAEPRLTIIWLDGWEKTIREDLVKATGAVGEWQHYQRSSLSPPPEATYVTVAARVEGGRAWFDDFFFGAQNPAMNTRPIARVLVNQVGYGLGAPKSAVVATNFFPSSPEQAHLEVAPVRHGRRLTVPLRCQGRIHDGTPDDWGSYYWRADFSALNTPGAYKARAMVGKASAQSPSFVVGEQTVFRETAQLGVEFFFVQRCGFEVPGWHKACHLDDAKLPDGRQLDAIGGWHSAGDYNKIMYENGDGGVMYALLTAYLKDASFFERSAGQRNGLPCILDEAWWGAKFVAKMQIPESGGLRNTISQGPGREWMKWSPPEVHTDTIVGTADDPVIQAGEGHSPLAIGGWARLSVLLQERGIHNDYLERARRLWDYATNNGANVSGPHLLMSAAELHAVTGDGRYLEAARRCAESVLAGQQANGRLAGAFGSYGELDAGALAFFALRYPDDPLCARIGPALRCWITFCRSTADNPFGLSKQSVGPQDYFFEPTSALGHNWELLTRAWAAMLCAAVNRDQRALRYAVDQIDWVLGKNPYGLCMFEGKGMFNPPRYHHRYDSIPGHERGAVPGCVPNGFVRTPAGLDQPGFDLSRPAPGKRHPSYRTSEPWLTHNMWFLMATSAMP